MVAAKSSRLFTLPLELREEVYKSALASSAYGTAVLRTCREVHVEARKILYSRPLKFRDQGAWFTWMEATPADLLGNVSEIALHVQDVNLKSILDGGIYKPLRQSPRLLTAELYQDNATRIKNCLKLLPHLKALTIHTPSCRPSHLYCGLVTQILSSIGSACPHLSQLRLEGNFRHYTLDFLLDLTNLESLTLEGPSQSTPESTAAILSVMPHLTSLSLISNGAPISSDPRQHRACTMQRYCFNGDTLRKAQKLDLLSLTENGLLPSPRACLTTNILDALHDHTTLRRLSLRLAYTPDTSILSSMTNFLKHTLIECLELDWPNLQALEIKRHHLLVRRLGILWIKVGSVSSATELLDLIRIQRERCPDLHKVVLVRSTSLRDRNARDLDDDHVETQFSAARQALRKSGIQVAWYTEEL